MRPHVVSWLAGFLPDGIAASLAPSWFSCVGLAGLVGLLLMMWSGRKRGIESGVIASVVLWCYVAAVLAGIVVPMTIDAIGELVTTGSVHLHWAGMTSFWGYLAGGIAVAIVCKQNGLPLAKLGDMAAAPMGVSLVFARFGCFFAGCDYGKVTSVPWAVRFPAGSPAWHDQVKAGLLPPERIESLAVHPTQLYEALVGIVIVGVAMWAVRRKWRDGRVFLAAAATYSVGRIIVEAFRGDLGRGIYLGLSSGQIFSICVLAAIGGGLLMTRRRLVGIAATAAVALALFDPHPASAQPSPDPAPPYAPPYAPPTAPAPAPYAPPYAPPYTPPPAPQPRSSTAPAKSPIHIDLAVLGGLAIPINRRPEQVAALAGPSISIGFRGEKIGIWLDVDSLGNRDASHGTLLFSAGVMNAVGGKLIVGARVGIGATLVNFDEPAFHDVTGTALRFEGLMEYAISNAWRIDLRPLSFDILTAADLGGPIATWQTRIGIAYAFDYARKAAPPRAAPPPPSPQPYAPPYAPPYQPQPAPAPVSRNP